MKVKIGDTIYDSAQEPILLVLTPRERLDIIGMPSGIDKYVAAPVGIDLRTSSILREWVTDIPAEGKHVTKPLLIEGKS